MEDGWSESGQVMLPGEEQFCFPRVWEDYGVQFGVTEHLLAGDVIKGTVDGGVEGVPRGGGQGLGQ